MNRVARPFLLLPLLAIAACSGPSEPLPGAAVIDTPPRTFSPEDKRVAQKLSISAGVAPRTGNPQDKALLCELGLEALGSRLEATGLLSDEQERVFGQAQALYRRRAAEGRSAEDIAAARRSAEDAHPSANDRARIGTGCLRELI